MILLPHYYIYADGSCGTRNACTGAWAAIVASRVKVLKVLYGCSRPTTISRCELEPIVAGVRHIRTICGARNGAGIRVAVYSDSECTMQLLASGEESSKNTDLYAGMKDIAGELSIAYNWRERNSHPYMAICDAVCSKLRHSLIDAVTAALGDQDIENLVPFENPPDNH